MPSGREALQTRLIVVRGDEDGFEQAALDQVFLRDSATFMERLALFDN
jgi:hypothetical protein